MLSSTSTASTSEVRTAATVVLCEVGKHDVHIKFHEKQPAISKVLTGDIHEDMIKNQKLVLKRDDISIASRSEEQKLTYRWQHSSKIQCKQLAHI
jgi:hypothetical protein